MVAEGVKTTAAVLELARPARRRDAARGVRRARALRRCAAGRPRARADAAQGEARAPRHAMSGVASRSVCSDGARRARSTSRVRGPRPRRSRDRLVGRRRRPLARFPPTSRRRASSESAPAPIVETAVRVPGGDVVQRRLRRGRGGGAVVVVEVENRSPAPFTVALVVRVDRRGHASSSTARCCGSTASRCSSSSRPPGAWAAGSATADARAWPATRAPARSTRSRPGRARVALPGPAPHACRVALGDVGRRLGADRRARPARRRCRGARAGSGSSSAGMQAELADADRRRASTPRGPTCCSRRVGDPTVVAALEDWGFDDEAADGWAASRMARRGDVPAGERARRPVGGAARDRRRPRIRRRFLLRCATCSSASGRTSIELLPGFPPEWLGPVGHGRRRCRSAPGRCRSRCAGTAPARRCCGTCRPVSSCARRARSRRGRRAPAGETLLAEPPASLLPMGAGNDRPETGRRAGQFS